MAEHEAIKWRCSWKLEKFDGDAVGEPREVIDGEGNLLVNAGINRALDLICGAGGTSYANANAHIGVGDSSTAAAAGQTDLQAATNKLRKAMDGGYPTAAASQSVSWKSTFGTSDANFAWNEWAIFNAAAAGTMLNRKVAALGTKTSAESWALTVSVSLA